MRVSDEVGPEPPLLPARTREQIIGRPVVTIRDFNEATNRAGLEGIQIIEGGENRADRRRRERAERKLTRRGRRS